MYITHDVPKIYTNPVGMTFSYIKPGSFMMGKEEGYPGTKVDVIKGFYLQTTEVTQAQWEKVMGTNPAHFRYCGPTCPVDSVSREDINEFMEKLTALIPDKIHRLPTETEWEYAAATGSTIVYTSQKSYEPELQKVAWYLANSNMSVHPVGKKAADKNGIYDLMGNVFEWCRNPMVDTEDTKVLLAMCKDNPNAKTYVIRGGSFRTFYYYCQPSVSTGRCSDQRLNDVGFRVVIQL